MALSAFGVEDGRISKVEGDKKKTKYTGALLGGSVLGGQIGARGTARAQGSSYKTIRRTARAAAGQHMVNNPGEYSYNTPKEAFASAKKTMKAMKAVPGFRAVQRGGAIGAGAGAVAGVGALAIHRHNRTPGAPIPTP